MPLPAKVIIPALSVACFSLLCNAAHAQEVALPGLIVVEGDKVERDLQDTYNGVQVFTSQIIEDESTIEDIDDVLDQTANVTQRFGGEGFAIRGISNGSVAGVGVSPLGTLYVDGTPFNSFALRTGIEELWDVDQVEVFKGPQSTTFGRNALAGTVVIRTKDPVYRNTMKARLTGGTQGTRGVAGTINANLIDQVLAIRISGDYNDTDGFYDNPTLGIDDQAFSSNKTVRAKILFEPTSAFSNVVTLAYSLNESGDDEADRTLDPFDRNHFGNIQGGEDTETVVAALDSKLQLNPNMWLKNIFTYNRARYDRLDDEDASFTGVLAGTNAPGNDFSFFRNNLTQTITEELRLHYQDERFRAHVGAYYSRIESDDDSGGRGGIPAQTIQSSIDNLVPFPFNQPPFSTQLFDLYSGVRIDRDRDNATVTTNYAGFGEVSYDFTPFITAYAGLRYDKEKFEFSSEEVRTFESLPGAAECGLLTPICNGFNAVILADAAGLGELPDIDSESEAWLPLVGTTLNWTEDLSTSFTVKRGYRAGGGGVSVITGTLHDFGPEFVWNYELALRSQWFNKALTVNSNVFFMEWTDQQVTAPGPGGAQDVITVNAGKSESYGGELEVYARPMDGLALRGSAGYLHTEFVEFMNGDEDLSGNEFPNAPEWTFAAAARYQFDTGLYLLAEANYRDHAFVDPQNRPESFEEARTIVNGRIGYKTGNIDAYVYSTNIFDVDYIASQFALDDTAKVGDGRFVGVRVTVTNE